MQGGAQMASPRRGQALSALLCEGDPAEAARRLRAAAAAAADLAALLDRDPGRLRSGGGVMFTHHGCILPIENRYVPVVPTASVRAWCTKLWPHRRRRPGPVGARDDVPRDPAAVMAAAGARLLAARREVAGCRKVKFTGLTQTLGQL
jgi:hypothetical protein